MNRILGVVLAWGVEDWIKPTLIQASNLCDEVLVVVTHFSAPLQQFEDKTRKICEEFNNVKVKLLDYTATKNVVSQNVAATLNHMIESSEVFGPGNWIWMLDTDEFYLEHSYTKIKDVIQSNKYDSIKVEAKFFFINMHNYLEGSHDRLVKIKSKKDRFRPTSQWPHKSNVYTLPRADGLFHYSMLTNTNIHKVRWATEYLNTKQNNKTRWLDEIYYKYELDNEDYWVNKNKKLSGIKSPWFNKGFTPDKDGKLFKYDGPHPKVIEDVGFHKVVDFRKYYI